MPPRCQCCEKLFISDLVALAEEEFSGNSFPQHSFYQHHSSFKDLEGAAHKGCDFCQFVLECFQGTDSQWPFQWLGTDCETGESMYDEAMDLDDSSVKISINTEHVFTSECLEMVKAFDSLFVQVGPNEDYPPEDELDDYHAIPKLRLLLSTPKEKPIYVGNFRIGRLRVDPILSSVDNFNIARSWLKECRETHPHCFPRKAPELPTRVVDVGNFDGSEPPRILISNGREAEYITLSHCWGGELAALLTAKTQDSFQKALPYGLLPNNFKDAIKVTRELGCRYLWIDALCIIQDSTKDWQLESVKMDQYYQSSMVTISAMSSTGSKTGFLKSSVANIHGPKPTTLWVFSAGNEDSEVEVHRMDPEEETLRSLNNGAPLASRGWALQESILSPRTIFYGSHQIYWKCLQGFQAADGTPPGNRFPETQYRHLWPLLYNHVLEQPKDKMPDKYDVFKDYHQMVMDYSQRNLTYDSDKLPAFSCLAQRLHPYIGGDYLAGIWSLDFKQGLLWYREFRQSEHVQPYRAPSWSWAVTNQPVVLSTLPLLPSPRELKLIGSSITLRDPSNPYGQVEAAVLMVEGLVVPLLLSLQNVNPKPSLDEMYGIAYFDEKHRDEGGQLDANSFGDIIPICTGATNYLIATKEGEELDGVEIDSAKYVEDSYFALLVHTNDTDGGEFADGITQCLILRPVDSEQGGALAYQRVGYIMLYNARLEWLDMWEIQRLILI